jgi:hypothetical protein
MTLSDSLIESLIEEMGADKVVAIYPGRFQPAGLHHFETYKWLVSKFGANNVFVATSNLTDPAKSPLNFDDKKKIWMKYGVPANKIIQTKSPYSAVEITEKLSDDTAIVFGFGEKDAGRLVIGTKKSGEATYLQDYEKNKNNLQGFKKHGYVLTLPHTSIKVSGRELSGTEIRNLIATQNSPTLFKQIFGWYDLKLSDLMFKKFSQSEKKIPLKEGGNMFDQGVSQVKQSNLDSTISHTLELYGLDKIQYSKIGNHQKDIMGDIDIAIDSDELAKFLKVNPTKEELFPAIKAYFEKIGAPKSFVFAPGLNQIHLLGIAQQPNGFPQEFVGADKEDATPFVQLDIMLGKRNWRDKLYSGAPGSEYKAKYRNLFIMEIFAQLIEDEGSIEGVKQKYMLTPGEGFYLQKFTLTPKGKRKEISREFKSDDMNFVSKFLFGDDKSFSDIDTFEKVYALFKSNSFKFPEIRDKVIQGYKESISAHTDSKNPSLTEDKISIQRFHGTSEMSDGAFLRFLQKIQPLVKSGKLDLSVNDNVSVTEKLDGSPCMFGLNQSGKFYLESANSGEITVDLAERFNNPFTSHFYQALLFLNSYVPFQRRLQAAFKQYGFFKITSEMFPVLTHKGNEFGDVVFASTKYNRAKLGNKGAFVCFGAVSKDGDTTSDGILNMIINTEDPEWKVYNILQHGNLSREGLVFDFSGVQDFIEDPKKLAGAMTLLRSRKDTPEKLALKKMILTIRKQLQGSLNQYAEKINSFLSHGDGKYPVEGVVMKIRLPDEDIFIKGTSEIFHQIAEKTWGTRKALGNLEKVLDGEFLKNVFGFKTTHAATINKAIQSARQTVGPGTDEVTLNKIALAVFAELRENGDRLDSENIRKRASDAVATSSKELLDTLKQWEKVKPTVDPDTAEKTDQQIKFVVDKFKKLKEAIGSTNYKGVSYIIYLLRFLLDKKITNSGDNL